MASLLESMENAKEPVVAPEGEYEVGVIQAEVVPTKKDNKPMLRLGLKIVGEIAGMDAPAKIINEFAVLPHDTDDEEIAGRRGLAIRRICEALGHNWREAAPETTEQAAALMGKSTTVTVRLEHDDQYGDQNRIRWPALSGDTSSSGGGRSRARA